RESGWCARRSGWKPPRARARIRSAAGLDRRWRGARRRALPRAHVFDSRSRTTPQRRRSSKPPPAPRCSLDLGANTCASLRVCRSMLERGYFTLFSVCGVPVRAHWTLPLGALLLSGGRMAPGLWLGVLLVIALHEAGHALLVHRYRLVNLRSEEHTSELQSREKLVCRLLLEKKNS